MEHQLNGVATNKIQFSAYLRQREYPEVLSSQGTLYCSAVQYYIECSVKA